MNTPHEVPRHKSSEDDAPRHKREWVAPTCTELPLLTELWLQGPQGSGIGGGGGPGGTVFPH